MKDNIHASKHTHARMHTFMQACTHIQAKTQASTHACLPTPTRMHECWHVDMHTPPQPRVPTHAHKQMFTPLNVQSLPLTSIFSSSFSKLACLSPTRGRHSLLIVSRAFVSEATPVSTKSFCKEKHERCNALWSMQEVTAPGNIKNVSC